MSIKRIKLFPIQILAIGFATIILLGGTLLSLPICSKTGEGIPFIDGIFTAASATCVTGLSVYDVYSQFNFLGQFIILLLIQVGGLGFMGVAMTFSFLMGTKITIFQRALLMESIGTIHMGGVVKVIRRMLYGTLIFEAIGAIIIASRFIGDLGFLRGVWYGIFHSISAFCNAGFDILGVYQPNMSMMPFSDDPILLITVMVLIVSGGIGFIVWSDVIDYRLNFRKYALHSKIMLSFTAVIILIGAVVFMGLEWNHGFSQMGTGEKVLNGFFCSVTPRTAGFATVDYTQLSTAGRYFTMVLMAIGAGPGSTGGGMKITTFAVIILAMYSYSKHYNDLSIFKRRLTADARRKAFSSSSSYLALILIVTFVLLILNPNAGSETCLFESFSALGTVGLSTGLTASTGAFSKGLLIFLMYCGRLGSISVAMAIARRKIIPKISYPEEEITVG